MVLKLNKSQHVDKMFRLLIVFKCKCLHFARVLFINGLLFFNIMMSQIYEPCRDSDRQTDPCVMFMRMLNGEVGLANTSLWL